MNTSPQPPLVRKRCVFYFPGYEPLSPADNHRRFGRGLDRFRRTWNVSATLSPPLTASDNGTTTWCVDCAGPNWRVETDVTLLDFSDIVVADLTQPRWRLIWRGLAAIIDFMLAGALNRYLRANWRYLLFFLYPLVLPALCAIVGFVVAWLAVTSGLPWLSASVAVFLGIACFVLLVHWAGRKLFLYFVLLDWSFAADIVYRRRPEFEVKLDRLAQALAERVRASAADEIVIVGFSLGAVVMMQVVARTLQHDQKIASDVSGINLVSVGSSLLKVGLHSEARHFRAAVATVISEPWVYWVEYQSIVDILNFYKTDPVTEMGLPTCGKPIVRIARIRKMVTEASYRRMRLNPLRLHKQFVFGNERRYFYDFFMMCCGPLRLQYRVECPADEAVVAFASDGTYRSPPEPQALINAGPMASVENQ